MKLLESEAMQEIVLDSIRNRGTIRLAAESAQITTRTIQNYRKENAEFDAKCKEAFEDYYDKLEEEAARRAYEGRDKPVFYQGKVVGVIKEQSDQLMMFLLTGGRPDKYAKTKHEMTGKDGKDLIPQMDNIEVARRIAYALNQAAAKLPEKHEETPERIH